MNWIDLYVSETDDYVYSLPRRNDFSTFLNDQLNYLPSVLVDVIVSYAYKRMAERPCERGLCEIEYSISGRAACYRCEKKIRKDVLRVAFKKQSQFFSGLQTTWNHFSCLKGRDMSRITQFDRWQELKYSDQINVRQACGEHVIINSPYEISRRQENERLFSMISRLKEKFNAEDVKIILQTNSIPLDGHIEHLFYVLAESWINGIMARCPHCHGDIVRGLTGVFCRTRDCPFPAKRAQIKCKKLTIPDKYINSFTEIEVIKEGEKGEKGDSGELTKETKEEKKKEKKWTRRKEGKKSRNKTKKNKENRRRRRL